MGNKKETIAGGITRKTMIWLVIIAIGLSFFVYHFATSITREFYTESYHNKMLITKEYTRRVLSDVYVAVSNNIYYLEQSLDQPDHHLKVMERIVKGGTRVRSCGISFIKDYYPEKGHRFCPFAWRNIAQPAQVQSANMGDADLDYLNADWFVDVINNDSAFWSDPFYDGYDEKTTLAAYMVPIHDQEGRVVAALGADVSLDWLTSKLNEMDSIINRNASFAAKALNLNSQSFIINHDGAFITHPEEARILKDHIYSHIEESDKGRLAEIIKQDYTDEEKCYDEFQYDGRKCFLFYTPLKYTDWSIVTVVPSQSIDMLSAINGTMLLLFMLLAMICVVVVCHLYMKRETKPLHALIKATDSIAKGRFDTPMPDIKSNNEMRQLCDSFENMQYAFVKYVDNLKSEQASEESEKQ